VANLDELRSVAHVAGSVFEEHLLLITDFEPTPMIDAVKMQKRETFHKVDPLDANRHLTYIR